MLVRNHIFYGIGFSAILFLIFPQIKLIGALIIFASSILIDTDHYIYYIFKKKSWNLRKSIDYFLDARERKDHYSGWAFLHGIETLIVIFILGFVHSYFSFVFIGVAFHFVLDWIEQIKIGWRWNKISLIYDYFKIKKLK